MNNTRTLAIIAVLTAATLVVGLTVAATMTTSAFAWKKDGQDKYMRGGQDDSKKDGQDTYNKDGGGNGNGNTVTVQINKQKAYQSGWDNTQEQEGQNTICTHPSESCVSEGSETPVVNNTSSNDDGEDGHGHPKDKVFLLLLPQLFFLFCFPTTRNSNARNAMSSLIQTQLLQRLCCNEE